MCEHYFTSLLKEKTGYYIVLCNEVWDIGQYEHLWWSVGQSETQSCYFSNQH